MSIKKQNALIFLILLAVASPTCKGKDKPEARIVSKELPRHTIVFGGDVITGRRMNYALFDKKARGRIFGDVKPLIERADLAIVNVEGVISNGGHFIDKNTQTQYAFRAHPRMIDVFVKAGIDIATVGNNHAGDYGPEALVEMLDRLTFAGIKYAGGGYNLADARRPAFQILGDTTVAVVGADLTGTKAAHAKPDRPGTYFFHNAQSGKNLDSIVKELTVVLKKARKHAHIVLFTPHWGRNWKTAPTKSLRKLAKSLIKAGYDGILGHSAHLIHGVEIIDGKPVIYDAGNLVLDNGHKGDSHRCLLWELEVTRAGITAVKGYPLWLKRNHSTMANDKESDKILAMIERRSSKLGTKIEIRDGTARLECEPGAIAGPKGTPTPPSREKPGEIREAPSDVVLEALPKGATKIDVRYPEGIRLIGYKLVAKQLTKPLASQVVALYFTADRQVEKQYQVYVEARGTDPKNDKPKKISTNHLTGDWILPSTEWPVGKVIQDWTMIMLTLKPEGRVNFYAGLKKRKLLRPENSDVPLVDDKLIRLGEAVYSEKPPNLFNKFDSYREKTAY